MSLFTDSNRFGTKMLEKMGWSKGKGLGANLDGELNFIRVSHKDNTQGVGYEDRDDQWTQHESDFNSLLKSLDNSREQSENENSKSGESEDEGSARVGFGFAEPEKKKKKKDDSITSKISGKSLEEMSKNSRARVHYKKFTRGKDISKYSAKDLANIFGKKAGEDVTEPKKEEEEKIEENEEESLSKYGIVTIETGKTIGEYFYNKKLNKNAKKEETEPSVEEIKEKKKKRKHEETVDETEIADEEIKKEKKKKKEDKQKMEEVQDEQTISNENSNESEEVTEVKEKKKKKKSKKEKIENETVENGDVEAIEEIEEVKTKSKKKKSKKEKSEEVSDENVECSEVMPKANQLISNILSSVLFANENYSTDEASTSNGEIVNRSSLELQKFAHETYELNRFQAELFRFVDFDAFKNSNISELRGYGYGDKIDLKITAKTQDQNRISDLWDTALVNKYGRDAVKSKKNKQYGLRKKSVFRAI